MNRKNIDDAPGQIYSVIAFYFPLKKHRDENLYAFFPI